MADQTQRLGIVVYVEDQATGKLTRVKAEVAGLGQSGAAAGRGMATGAASIERSAGRIGGALSHAKGAIGGLLTGPLGILGLGAGVLTLGGAFSTGINKAQTWGLQIEKLQGITHDSAASLSGLLAVTEKYGLSNERLAQIAGFTEKALGNLTKGVDDQGHEVKGAATFVKDYGFNIYDAHGKVKSFSTLLLSFSDYWVKDKNRTEAAAAAAKLFGRGFADLVPILNLGSKGIKDAEEEARALGLTLTQDNVTALAKAREATRQWGDALGGLELQVGLALLPKLTDLAHWASSFVSEHRDQIVGFFSDAADFAAKAAGTIGDLAGAAGAFWGSLPAPFRDLLVKGIVADRTIHFLFGFSPLEAAGSSLLKGLTGTLFSRGSSPANPMFVSDISKGVGGIPGGGPGGLPLWGAGGLILAGVAAAEVGIADLIRQALHPTTSGDLIQNYSASEAADYHSGRKNVEQILADRLDANNTALEDQRHAMLDGQSALQRNTDAMGHAAGVFRDAHWLTKLEASWQKAGQTMHDKIKAALADLAAGKNVHGAAAFLGGKLGNAGFGAGGYDQAVAAIATLKTLNTKDPAVVAAIKQLEGRLPRLATDKKDLAAAIKIAQSDEPKAQQLSELNGIMRDLRAHGDATTRKKVEDLIAAVRAKKMSVKVDPTVKVYDATHVRVDAEWTVGGATTRSSSDTSSRASTDSRFYGYTQGLAAGGRYYAGRPRLTGEQGPELDVPDHSGTIFDATKTQRLLEGAYGGHGLANAMSHVTNPRALEALAAAIERLATRPVYAYASARDVVASTHRRGSSRARQIGW